MGKELYPDNYQNHLTFWPLSSSGKEIDLRQEFHDFIYGSAIENAHGQIGVLRRMRHDANDNLTVCPCVNSKTLEPNRDTPCHFCWGEGYMWDEEWVPYYLKEFTGSGGRSLPQRNFAQEAGLINASTSFIYLEHDATPSIHDKFIVMKLDVDGKLIVPYRRERIYKISTCQAMRSDNGRVEYWRLAVVQEAIKANWQE